MLCAPDVVEEWGLGLRVVANFQFQTEGHGEAWANLRRHMTDKDDDFPSRLSLCNPIVASSCQLVKHLWTRNMSYSLNA